MKEGTIAKIMEKGFGFIAEEGQEKDLFFHAKDVLDEAYDLLAEGDAVTFEVVDGPKGPAASSVSKA
jgi:CspA family cold shock protein